MGFRLYSKLEFLKAFRSTESESDGKFETIHMIRQFGCSIRLLQFGSKRNLNF